MALFILYAVPVQILALGIVGIDISGNELEWFIAVFSAALLLIIVKSWYAWIKKSKTAGIWITALYIMISAAVGLSSHLYIPIRAAENPAINENNPSNWTRFKGFLERKQYQQESMVERMFKRRASWKNQLLSHPQFGLLYYFEKQYASPDTKITLFKSKNQNDKSGLDIKLPMLYIILIGLWGLYESIKRSPPEGLLLLFTFLLCTVGLVIYMNFSDGTYNPRIAPIAEVRDRDYFYTPGFMYFGIIIGLGVTYALRLVGKFADLGRTDRRYLKFAFIVSLAGALALAANTVYANYGHNDRSGNYLPADYAKNILSSCGENAIIFTNGDNDTFPLWYIQEVEKFRTDIRVVNLSLLNASWYIHQLKDRMNVPVTLSDSEIDGIRPMRYSNTYLRVQDLMIQHIVTNVQKEGWKIPVCFAITVPDDNRMGLDDNLIMEGMTYRVVETKGRDRVNKEVGWRIFANPENFRGLGDVSVVKDDNERKLVSNYMVSMFKIAQAYADEGKLDSAIQMARKAVEIQGENPMWQSKAYLAKMYADVGEVEKIIDLAAGDENGEKILLASAQNAMDRADYNVAVLLLETSFSTYPASLASVNNLAILYRKTGEESKIDSVLNLFKKNNRGNDRLLAQADQLIERLKYLSLPPEGSR
jgi:tetratricopeptide (TPR) repeat protein